MTSPPRGRAGGAPGHGGARELTLDILPQPNDWTCGATCLHAVYRYHADVLPLDQVISEVRHVASGGTLAVQLANHALSRGYRAIIYTYNLHVFDPTWFPSRETVLREKLRAQAKAKEDPRLQESTRAYLEYLELGGELRFEDLTAGLIRRWLERDRPILTGLSSTFLYRCAREVGSTVLHPDDVNGVATGHFVVLCGYEPEDRKVLIADPYQDNPSISEHPYWVSVERVIGAILLGVLTSDANLLILEPPREESAR